MVPAVPALAALFDMMTTDCLKERFTAEEAYRFFKDSTAQLPEGTLRAPVSLKIGFAGMVNNEVYWSKLSARDRAIWACHRNLPVSWWTSFLGWVTDLDFGFKSVLFVRRILRI